ncbi:hypothetical protein BD779DRAFT_559340 [Infundibulicybe gibba]|nr:hypothetical protein BD779DRAFT_559340 [Infundibulicybe gibba]
MSATITSSVVSQMPSASSPASGNAAPLEQTGYLSTTITSIIACLTPMLALMYLCMLSWTYRYAQRNPRTFSKASSMLLQRYTPIVYAFMVLSSLAEVAVASWLLLQYRFHQNFPAVKTRTGTQLLLFAACWTVLTAGAYTVLFLHPTWYRHQISSVGAQRYGS